MPRWSSLGMDEGTPDSSGRAQRSSITRELNLVLDARIQTQVQDRALGASKAGKPSIRSNDARALVDHATV